MKIIQSAGGPLIGVSSNSASLWGGIEGTPFMGIGSGFPNDYEAAGYLTVGVHRPPCEIAVLKGSKESAILLSSPMQTCVLHSTPSLVQIAQVHYADLNWSFSEVDLSLYKTAKFQEQLEFDSVGGAYMVFDAACPGRDALDDDYLTFVLNAGLYGLSAALVEQEASLIGLISISQRK